MGASQGPEKGSTEIGFHQPSPPESAVAIQERTARRQAASQMLAAQDQVFDLADLTDEQFERELKRMETRLTRIRKIVDSRLKEDVHFGIPKTRDGKDVPGIKKPFLYAAGAEELRNIYRYTLKLVDEPSVVADAGFTSVTVTIGVFDSLGRLVCARSGNCNTKEKRFQKSSGGWTYADAREMVHSCYTMAEKRAGVLATREATGVSALFAAPDELEKAMEDHEDAPPATPWTEDEKTKVYKLAHGVGIKTADDFLQFATDTLGRPIRDTRTDIGTGSDVEKILAEIAARKAGQRGPLAGSGEKDVFVDEGKKE